MSEQRFYITDTGLGLDTVSDEMYSFGDEEDFCRLFDKLNEQQATITALKEENEQLRQIMNDIVVATDETYTKNTSMFKVTVVLDFEKYMEIRRCIE